MQVLGKRLERSVGTCPECQKPISGVDLLSDGQCRHCGANLLNVLAETPKPGLNDADVKVVLTAIGVFLALALVSQS